MNRSTENGKRFYLVLCELHCMEIHGKNEDSDKYIDTHYILCDRFNPQTGIAYSNFDDYEDEDDIDFISENAYDNDGYLCRMKDEWAHMRKNYRTLLRIMPNITHPTVRNYRNIISNKYYIKPELAQCITLSTHETIAIIKTIWIKIIQRKWRSICNEKKKILTKRTNPNNIIYKQIHGRWPDSCKYMPALKGMLYSLRTSSS